MSNKEQSTKKEMETLIKLVYPKGNWYWNYFETYSFSDNKITLSSGKSHDSVTIKLYNKIKPAYDAGYTAAKEEAEREAWISVEDRLPNLGERVLTLSDSKSEYPHVEICNYVSDYWTRSRPGFLDEQDEQPGMVRPDYWKRITIPNL